MWNRWNAHFNDIAFIQSICFPPHYIVEKVTKTAANFYCEKVAFCTNMIYQLVCKWQQRPKPQWIKARGFSFCHRHQMSFFLCWSKSDLICGLHAYFSNRNTYRFNKIMDASRYDHKRHLPLIDGVSGIIDIVYTYWFWLEMISSRNFLQFLTEFSTQRLPIRSLAFRKK